MVTQKANKKSGPTLSAALGRIAEAKKKLAVETQKLKKGGRKLLMKEAFTHIFKAHPVVTGLRWDQFTPRWNDGEPCIFESSGCRATFKGAPEDGGEFGDGFFDIYDIGRGTKDPFLEGVSKELFGELKAALTDVGQLLEVLGDDVLLELFGDPATITVTVKGIQVEETVAPH